MHLARSAQVVVVVQGRRRGDLRVLRSCDLARSGGAACTNTRGIFRRPAPVRCSASELCTLVLLLIDYRIEQLHARLSSSVRLVSALGPRSRQNGDAASGRLFLD